MNNLIQEVTRIAKKAGEKVLFYYDKDYEVVDKGGDSPLTQADLASNEYILSELEKYGYGILSEEKADDAKRLSKDSVWIVDPMDGTKDFINKTGEFTIMIGLVEKRGDVFRPILGVVYVPSQRVIYYASENAGAFMQKEDQEAKKIKVVNKKEISEMIMIGSRFHESELETEIMKERGMKERVVCGSAGLKLCKIAEGVADLNINPSDKTWEWDVCAADIILKEAGGVLTDTKGQGFVYNKKDPRNLNGYVAGSSEISI